MTKMGWLLCFAITFATHFAFGQDNPPGEALSSGDYQITQTWSQERKFARPYHVQVPSSSNLQSETLPVLVFLHGNGANAKDAMRGFIRGRSRIAREYILVFPQGYRESWNIVSERSKADDLAFIESIVKKLITYKNVQSDGVTLMGASNGAALVNQIAIESSLPSIGNFVTGVSQLNVWQHNGGRFKAKGADNLYRNVVNPSKGKRLLNISGVHDRLVPYRGGHSNAIPAHGGKLAFLDAEESTYLWAQHFGYRGRQLQQPTAIVENVEIFKYLDGDVIHYKVINEGHGATHGISERLLLDFLDGTPSNPPPERSSRNKVTTGDSASSQKAPKDSIDQQRTKIFEEIEQTHRAIERAEEEIENATDDNQAEALEKVIHESEVRVEILGLKLEILERRADLEELAREFDLKNNELSETSDELFKMLDLADRFTERFGEALTNNREEIAGELEEQFIELEHDFENRREVLQIKIELIEAKAEGDEDWIRDLERELRLLGAGKQSDTDSTPRIAPADLPKPMQLTENEIQTFSGLNFSEDILPRLKSACFECHNRDDASGDLDLQSLVETRPLVINRRHWLNIIEQLKVRSMPPIDASNLADSDRRIMLGWLFDRIENFDYTTISRVGSVPAKRFTHEEYNNTVRDLVGIDLRPADRFPADLTASSGFENSANSLFIQPVTLERYIGAAESIVQSAWPMRRTTTEQETAWELLMGGISDLESVDHARQVIRRFASRAYRRPLNSDEADSLFGYFLEQHSKGKSIPAAVREVLQIVLISPNFLMRAEGAPESSEKVPISGWELASRLSYFLWASMPDEELFELARSKRLHEPKVLAQQVTRMLADPKSQTLGHLFAAQWLGFAELDRVQRDQIDNPWATDTLVEAMKNESAMLFNSLIKNNSSIDRLLDANYTFVNEELAGHYRIPNIKGTDMRRVALNDSPRRGILGHASILATTSFPHRTSPVLRGNWILTTLLGTPPPPPPPNVSQFNDRVAENERLSSRQKLELHRSNPRCYACHSQIDPLGFALEEFEWFGRYRPQREGKRVDTIGMLPNGTEVNGLRGLAATLVAEQSEDLGEQLTRKLLAYALGRQLEYFDEALVRALTNSLNSDKGRVNTLIRAITQSETFLNKQAPPNSH